MNLPFWESTGGFFIAFRHQTSFPSLLYLDHHDMVSWITTSLAAHSHGEYNAAILFTGTVSSKSSSGLLLSISQHSSKSHAFRSCYHALGVFTLLSSYMRTGHHCARLFSIQHFLSLSLSHTSFFSTMVVETRSRGRPATKTTAKPAAKKSPSKVQKKKTTTAAAARGRSPPKKKEVDFKIKGAASRSKSPGKATAAAKSRSKSPAKQRSPSKSPARKAPTKASPAKASPAKSPSAGVFNPPITLHSTTHASTESHTKSTAKDTKRAASKSPARKPAAKDARRSPSSNSPARVTKQRSPSKSPVRGAPKSPAKSKAKK